MSYYSNSNQSINIDPQITRANLIVEFINDTCRFCPGYSIPTQEIYLKYERYCKDSGAEPSTFNVFSISWISSLSIGFIFLSLSARCISKKLSLSALDTTQKLDKLIAAAPNIGLNSQPNIGIHTPAANGIPITL